MRFVRGLLTLGFAVVTAGLVALVLLVFLGATGRSPVALRYLANSVARFMAGQRVEQIALVVDVEPRTRTLRATAQLEVRAVDGDRDRVYFLLSDGLRIERVVARDPGGDTVALRPLRLGMLTAVELATALAADQSVGLEIPYAGEPLAGSLSFGGGVLAALPLPCPNA